MRYRYRITGIRRDEPGADPEAGRRVAYDPYPAGVLFEHQARDALYNMKRGAPWQLWRDLRIERLPLQTEWEPVD